MKTFANMCVVAVILGVAMTGGTAKADFDNEEVNNTNVGVGTIALVIRNDLREFGISRQEQVFFRTRINQILQRAQQIDDLVDGPDDQVEDEILELALQNRNTARQLLNRAEGLGNQELIGLTTQLEDLADQVVELVD